MTEEKRDTQKQQQQHILEIIEFIGSFESESIPMFA